MRKLFYALLAVQIVLICKIDFVFAREYHDLKSLIVALEDDTIEDINKPFSGYRIITPRNGLETPAPRHHQYSNACSFFSMGTITEHLGWSHFSAGASMDDSFFFWAQNNFDYDWELKQETLDVGYFGSTEHLITSYITAQTNSCLNYGIQDHLFYPEEFLAMDSTVMCDLNRETSSQYDCDWYHDFYNNNEYGFCDSSTTPVEMWLRRIATGTHDIAGSGIDAGAVDSPVKMYMFLNSALQNMDIAGCNDARSAFPSGQGDIDDMRRIIKGFVDANIPLLIAVKNGNHFVVLIGYANLDDTPEGLPRTAVAVDVNYHNEMLLGEHRYWIIDDIDDYNKWKVDGATDSIRGLFPWNQHLDEGCEAGGWAYDVDRSLDNSQFAICADNWPGWSLDCQSRFIGIDVSCMDDGKVKQEWFRYPESPFVAEQSNKDCDRLLVRYADGERTVTNAIVRRYRYKYALAKKSFTWSQISSHSPDSSNGYQYSSGSEGRGPITYIDWDNNWPDDHWLVAEGLSRWSPKRRTTVELTLDDDSKVYIEIAPPKTYGVDVVCERGRRMLSYFVEADVHSFNGTTYIWDQYDRVCNDLIAVASMGNIGATTNAHVESWGINGGSSWSQIAGPWYPDSTRTVNNGLSGISTQYSWNTVWPKKYWLSADYVGDDGQNHRKTLIHFSGIERNLWIVPR